MKALKTSSYIAILFTIFLACVAGPAAADLIGLTPSYPDLLANSQGTYNYDVPEQLLTINAVPNKLSYSATESDFDYIYPSDMGFCYEAKIKVDQNGDFIAGDENNLTIIGKVVDDNATPIFSDDTVVYDGILLTGKITNFGWTDTINMYTSYYQIFDFTFDVTGGSLADIFGSHGGAIALSGQSGFGSEGWEVNFSGEFVKVDNFPVPIPAAAWLLGSGLVGLAVLKRNRKRL
jgi:hypothetical protein